MIFNFLLWTTKKPTVLMLTEFMALTIFHKSRIGSPSCSLHGRDSMSGLPLYKIVQGSMVDYRCDVPRSLRSLTLWLGFSGRLLRHFIQGHQVSHTRGASRDGGQTTVSEAMVARNASWRDHRRSNSCEKNACFSSHRLHSTSWFVLLGVVSGDVGKTRSPNCAPKTPKLAQAAFVDASECQRPNTFHMARCNGVPRSPTTPDLVTGGGRTFLQ